MQQVSKSSSKEVPGTYDINQYKIAFKSYIVYCLKLDVDRLF